MGEPHDVYRSPEDIFTATFIGSPTMNLIKGGLRRESGRSVFSNEDLRLEMADIDATDVSQKSVYIGIRPENVALDTSHGGLRGLLSLKEPLGSITYLTVAVGKTSLIIQSQGDPALNVGGAVRLSVQGQISIFDSATGKRISQVDSAP